MTASVTPPPPTGSATLTVRNTVPPFTDRRLLRREADVRVELAMEVLEGGYWHFDVASETFETSEHLARYLAGPHAAPLDLATYVAFILAEDHPHADLSPLISGNVDRSAAEYRVRTAEGLVRWMRCSRRLIRDSGGTPSRVVGVAVDVTEQKRLQAYMEAQAKTDPLTALSNRRGFEERAEASFARALNARTPYRLGLLSIDLDRFKPINDTYGHAVGDQVLQMVSNRLLGAIRPIDLAARLGGDEFAILVDDADEDALIRLAARLLQTVAAPMRVNGKTLHIGCSIGCAAFRPGDTGVSAILARADGALYESKAQGRDTWRLAA